MTIQIQDEIEFKNENFKLIGNPFVAFLEKNKHITFDSHSTYNSRGYMANWKLSDKKLFLTDLDSSNLKFEDLFKTKEPVLADWFTGILQFGFGKFKDNHWWGTYENYVWLEFENGELKKRRIKKHADLDDNLQCLNFGKYKHQFLKDVILGKINQNKEESLTEYLSALLFYLTSSESSEDVIMPNVNFNYNELLMLDKVKNDNIKFNIIDKIISFSSDNLENLIFFLNIFEKILKSNFFLLNNQFKYRKKFNKLVNQSTVLLNPDCEYINSLILKNEDFCCPPPFIQNQLNLKKLLSFETIRITEKQLEYQPLLINANYKFSQETIDINKKKYYKEFRVDYDEKYDAIFYDFRWPINIEMFQYYISDKIKRKYKEYNEYEDYEDYESNNTWIRNNFDEDDIDTVLGNLD